MTAETARERTMAAGSEPAADTELLQLRYVTKRWSDVTVLDDVDLHLPRGRITWVCGDNGVGKTTLLRIATGLILPDSGTVTLVGLRPDHDRRAYHERIGFLAAGDRGLYARLSVRQNLEFSASISFLRGSRRRSAVTAAIDRFDLGSLASRRVDRLSMGQRQRVRLALTFLHDPEMVLLDEPRTSLDENGLRLLTDALDEVTRRDGAALWCSPTGDDTALRYDDAYVLRDGKLRPW